LNKTLAPEKVEACLTELAKWFVKNRRQMEASDLRPIATKYFGFGEELTEFYNYIASPEGDGEFRKYLRLEAWKAGLAGPKTTKKIWDLGEWWEEEYSTAEAIVYRSADGKKRLYLYWDGTKEVKPAPQLPSDVAESKFSLGQVLMTRGVNDLVAENAEFAQFVTESLKRHVRGDWGDLPEEDKKENELSLREGFRLLSAYEKPPLPKIWIITEADRSATTILFPSEY